MATIDLGKIKITWRGTYNGSTAYAVDDAVAYTDSSILSSYICTTASTGNAPSSSGTAHSSWAYLAKGGAAGADGSTPVGKETMWIPANAMYPNTTNGCSALAQVELSNGPEYKVLDFDTSSDEFAQFAVAMPKSWNESTVTFKAYFTSAGTNTGTVSWALNGVALSDNDSLNTAFGTAVAPTAKAHSGTASDINVTAESGAITIAGSPAAEDIVMFQIMRDVSADDMTGDARLLGIKLYFTTDAVNDA